MVGAVSWSSKSEFCVYTQMKSPSSGHARRARLGTLWKALQEWKQLPAPGLFYHGFALAGALGPPWRMSSTWPNFSLAVLITSRVLAGWKRLATTSTRSPRDGDPLGRSERRQKMRGWWEITSTSAPMFSERAGSS